MNHHPVSLTCITCKLFEHIICKHIWAHLEDHKILTDLQHGFRSGISCETQLVTTFQDLAQMHNKKGSQIDIAVLTSQKLLTRYLMMVSLVVVYPLPWPLLVGGVRCSRLASGGESDVPALLVGGVRCSRVSLVNSSTTA